jgi:hypothetical protein
MHAIYETFKKEAEELLNPIIDKAKKYYGDDESGYFNWLQKAAFIKMHAPDTQIETLTPKLMARPLNQALNTKT